MGISNTIAAAVMTCGLMTAQAFANMPPSGKDAVRAVTVKEYPLNFEIGGAGAGTPITLYRHQGDLAFVVIDSIDTQGAQAPAYRVNIGSIGYYDNAGAQQAALAGFQAATGRKQSAYGVFLPLRNGESITLQLARDSTVKVKAHVMVVSGYREGRA